MRFAFSGFELDLERRELSAVHGVIPLEPKAFALLAYLLQHRDRAVPKAELFEVGWPEEFVSDAVLTRCVRLIRQALDDDGNKQSVIKTLRGYGYRFVVPVEQLETSSKLALVYCADKIPVHEEHPEIAQPHVVPEPASDVICSACQMLNRAERQFCRSCGHPLRQPCPDCGFGNNSTERFCGGCGQQQVYLAAPEVSLLDAAYRQITVMSCNSDLAVCGIQLVH